MDSPKEEVYDLDSLGISQGLLTYVENLKIETWREFPVTNNDIEQEKLWRLGPWQEKHAVTVLEKAEILSRFRSVKKKKKKKKSLGEPRLYFEIVSVSCVCCSRYVLCPREMPETRFWRLYFMLTRAYLKGKMPDDETNALRQFSCKPSTTAQESPDSVGDFKQETKESTAAETKLADSRSVTSTADASDGESIGSFVVLRDRQQDVNER